MSVAQPAPTPEVCKRLQQVVQSTAHSTGCAAAAFYTSTDAAAAELVVSVGADFPPFMGPEAYLPLCRGIAGSASGMVIVDDMLVESSCVDGSASGMVIVDDMLVESSCVAPDILPQWCGRPTRFFAAVRVCDRQEQPLGLLLLADHQPHPGLSAAKTYVFSAQAFQLAETLALHALRSREPGNAPGVTERLRLLESAVVNAKDAILITEAEPIDLPGPRIVYCNAAFTRTTGYSEAEIIGKTPRILQGEGTDPLSRAVIRASLSQWKPIEIEMLNYKRDGEAFWVELSIVPVADERGWFTHWVSVQRDITERKAAEEIKTRVRVAEAGNASLKALTNELRVALDAAEAANVAKSEFLANMSHEIRTPLNGVLGMTQALWMDQLTPVQRERVAIIRDCGQSLLAVLNDVLDLSKIEAGQLELELVEFDLEAIARGVCAAYTETANRNGVSFGLTLEERVRGLWLGDSVRVRQLLYNLVSNALKFTSQGEVQVSLDLVREGELRLRVRDTGIGVAPDKLEHLFSKFYQTDSSNTRRFGGTGLGLAICRQLCDLMGGSITAESVEGEGSTFSVILPMRQLSQKPVIEDLSPGAAGRPNAHPVAGRALQVLAAEDNLSNQLVLRALLQAFDITPTIVSNGAQAVEALTHRRFDLVLMDIQMPEMDGVTATRLIRAAEARDGLERTSIIALSANAMSHQVREYLAADMDGHIAKPIDIAQLAALLASLEPALAPV